MDKKCDECKKRKPEVLKNTVWVAGGRNAFDFCWSKTERQLCEDCENEFYESCDDCGAMLDKDYAGIGLPDESETYCPDCVQKHGIEVTYGVRA
jgi:hypothetical protein